MDAEITVLPLLQMASGDTLSLQQYRYVGAHPGKVVYLQSNFHGAEVMGSGVIYRLLADLNALDAAALQGEIRLITNQIKRSTNTSCQRLSRLVRKSLSFSKQGANPVGAI